VERLKDKVLAVDDRRLIAECLEGRTEAFEELVHRYEGRLYNTVFRLLDNAEDAQDVVQDAFLRAFQSLSRFKGESEFFTWLYRIAVNRAVSLRRKGRARVRRDANTALEPVDPSDESRPSHAVEKTEEAYVVQQALNRLTAQQRTVLVLKDVEEQKYEAIAEILDIPVGTVRSRLHRARMELRRLLEQG
jgi:RNA polymerase sigma-70 factor (ECF subfamily)